MRIQRAKREEERRRSMRIQRYEKASEKGVLTKDAKICIYKYTMMYRPIIVYLKFVMVHLAHKMYKSLQYLLIWREHGPRGDVSFMHTCYREVNMDKYARRNPGKAVPRIGEISFLSRWRFEKTVEMLERSPNVSTKQWLLAVSPFSPIQITTVMWEPSKLLERKKTAHGTDGRIQVKNSDWILYLQALHGPDGPRIVSLSKGRFVMHFYSEVDAARFADHLIPDVD